MANTYNSSYTSSQGKQFHNYKVITVIITFNPVISKFIDVLLAHLQTRVSSIIIIDNASINYLEIEKAVYDLGTSVLDLVHMPVNVGIGSAQNIGINRALKSDCSHVIIFDQDSIPSSNLLFNLLEDEYKLITAGIKVGAIGPIFFDSRTGSFYPLSKISGLILKRIFPQPGSDPFEVSFIAASGSLIRNEVFKLVGSLNEDFFIDCVDFEWCLRARSKGFRIFASQKTIMSHMVGDSRKNSIGREISIHSPLRRYYIARNSILLTRLPWVPLGYKIRELFYFLARVPFFLIAVNFNRSYLKYISKGIIHGILGRSGQYK